MLATVSSTEDAATINTAEKMDFYVTESATAMMDTSGSSELAEDAEPMRLSTEWPANATSDSPETSMESVLLATLSPSATPTKDTTNPSGPASVLLAPSMSEENAALFLPVEPTNITMVKDALATQASSKMQMDSAIQSTS